MNDLLSLESIRDTLIEESINKKYLLDIRYNVTESLKYNVDNINSNLSSLGYESLKISEKNIFNNPDESKKLVLENLITIQQGIVYGIKQFLSWLVKHIKKLYAWAKTSYPVYERIYRNILNKLVNIRKDIALDPVRIDEFRNRNRYMCFYMENNPHKTVTELIKSASEPFHYIDSRSYPIGDLDLKQSAIMIGHYDDVISEIKQTHPNARYGIMGIEPNQTSNEIKYTVFVSNIEKIEQGNEFEINYYLASKTISKPLRIKSNFQPNVDDCIKRIKEYIADIKAISNTYVNMAGMPEAIKIYERKMDRINTKFNNMAKIVGFDKQRYNQEANNCLFSISINLINTFLTSDKLAQTFLKDYANLYFNQIEQEKMI